MEFINNVIIQGVVVDIPYIVSSRLGRRHTVPVWTKLLNVEMLIVVTATSDVDLFVSEMERGDIVTISGRLFFANTNGEINHQTPIILASLIYDSGIDNSYGIEMLDKADLSKVKNVEKTKLPWEK